MPHVVVRVMRDARVQHAMRKGGVANAVSFIESIARPIVACALSPDVQHAQDAISKADGIVERTRAEQRLAFAKAAAIHAVAPNGGAK
jgi:hypothetical protein